MSKDAHGLGLQAFGPFKVLATLLGLIHPCELGGCIACTVIDDLQLDILALEHVSDSLRRILCDVVGATL